MKVLEAVRKLIRVQGKGTVAQVAKVAKVSFPEALDILDTNRRLLNIDKCGRIVGTWFDKERSLIRATAYKNGKAYRPGELLNYGSTVGIGFTKEANPGLFTSLAVTESHGGLGDSYEATFIKDTPENRAALEAAGVVDIATVGPTDADLWKE